MYQNILFLTRGRKMFQRSSGILMPITALPSLYGIGTLGKEAYEFIDFLNRGGQSYWQILPLGPTAFGDSPYQSFSSFAGNPYLLDLDLLRKEDLLKKEEFQEIDFGRNRERVDYQKIFLNKIPLFKKAFQRGKAIYSREIKQFVEENSYWVKDYALYMTLKFQYELKPWKDWPKDIAKRNPRVVKYLEKELKEEIDYWIFLQYIFLKQWGDIKKYASEKDIKIIGDIPIYVAEDSVDTWINPEIFLLDDDNLPLKVAGCPPDAFSSTGQLWGNPLYRWDVLEKSNFHWWINRIKRHFFLYDVLRIDHFRGFESYWAIPYGEKTAQRGQWQKGPDLKLFHAIEQSLGQVKIIAEDLGDLSPEVIEMRESLGYPGMKVLQFAFDGNQQNPYLPHHYDKNSVVYTGTHDNDTIIGWLEKGTPKEIKMAKKYLNLNNQERYHWDFIRGAWSSVADLAIAPMQDFLGLDSGGRMNIPSTTQGNWQWRAKKEDLGPELAESIRKLTRLYGR